jgi:hypothetical protein
LQHDRIGKCGEDTVAAGRAGVSGVGCVLARKPVNTRAIVTP